MLCLNGTQPEDSSVTGKLISLEETWWTFEESWHTRRWYTGTGVKDDILGKVFRICIEEALEAQVTPKFI